jgi:hypothetical protein
LAKKLGTYNCGFMTKIITGVNSPSEWKSITVQQVHGNGGGSLLNAYYGGSLRKALEKVYPEHAAEFSKGIHRGYWKNPASQRAFLETLAKELSILL